MAENNESVDENTFKNRGKKRKLDPKSWKTNKVKKAKAMGMHTLF